MEMPRNQPLTKGALALALASAVLASAAVTAPALADSAKFVPGMLSMDVGLHNSGAPQVVVRNVDASHQIGALDLAIQQTKVAFQAAAQVSCAGTVSENWKERRGYLLSEAAFGVGDSSFVLRKVILEHSTSIDHTSDSDIHLFQLPVGELADPQIGIDPVALVLACSIGPSTAVARVVRPSNTVTMYAPSGLARITTTITSRTSWTRCAAVIAQP
jgi:hypothetical protein